MDSPGQTFRSIVYSVLVHVVALGLLLVSIEFAPEAVFHPPQPESIISAVAVDQKQIQAELDRLKEAEQKKEEERRKKEEELQRKAAEAERKTREAEEQRRDEEARLAELAKKKEQEQKQREEEQRKLAEVKRQTEEIEKQRRLEEEKKRKAEEELKRAEEERRLAEEQRKRREAEAAMQVELAEEQRRLDAERQRQEQTIVAEYSQRIRNAIQQEFNLTGLPPGLSNEMRIRTIPGGEVVQATITRSSGNGVFDSRAEIAVSRASPLPVPSDPGIFDRYFRDFKLTFNP